MEIHPHNDAYSVMLNDTQDGVQKFYNKRIEDEEWYFIHQWKRARERNLPITFEPNPYNHNDYLIE